MTNYHNYDEPETCPYCSSFIHADFVDVGVGMIQCGPYHCTECGASEIGHELYDWVEKETVNIPGFGPDERYKENSDGTLKFIEGHPFTDEELKTGFYRDKISPNANTVNGRLVNHTTAKKAYDLGMLDEKL